MSSPHRPPTVIPLALSAVLLGAAPARADWPFPFVQITCAPELHYVSVRRIIVENAAGYGEIGHPYGWAATSKQTEARNGIFTSRSLADRPVTCAMPAGMTANHGERQAITVTVSAKIDPPPKNEHQEGSYPVTIMSAGQRLAVIFMDLTHQTQGTDSLELYANGVGATLRTCAFDQGSDAKLTCASKDFPLPN